MFKRSFSYFTRIVVVVLTASLLSACSEKEKPLEIPSSSSCGYRLPWSGMEGKIKVPQGYTGSYSHHKGTLSEYAIDFSLPEGVDTLAARGGIVSHVQGGKTAWGGEELSNEGNYVVINHEDKTSALYLHLQSVVVKKGQEIKQGQLIGYSGKTGFTEGNPHLHFQVQETTGVWFSQSIPVCFDDVSENRGVPSSGMILTPGDEIMKISGEVISGLPDLKGRVIVTIVSDATPPYKNKWDGWDHETAIRICELINCTPNFKELSWEEAVSTLAIGNSEWLAFSITITTDRQAVWDFAIPYANLNGTELISHAFPKGSDLVQPVNAALRYMLLNGEMSELMAKWDIPETPFINKDWNDLVGTWEGNVSSATTFMTPFTSYIKVEISRGTSGNLILFVTYDGKNSETLSQGTPNIIEGQQYYCFDLFDREDTGMNVGNRCFRTLSPQELYFVGSDLAGTLWGTLHKVGQNHTIDMGKPIIPLDPKDADSVVRWLSYALLHNDIAVFEQLLTDSGISYGTGFAGGRYNITKHEFLEMLKIRLINKVECRGYSGDNDHLMVWTSGWNPDWDDNQSYGAPWSSDELVFSFSETTQGLSLLSAYSAPSSAILESPSVEGKSCPTN